jgi:hypothetical protein
VVVAAAAVVVVVVVVVVLFGGAYDIHVLSVVNLSGTTPPPEFCIGTIFVFVDL